MRGSIWNDSRMGRRKRSSTIEGRIEALEKFKDRTLPLLEEIRKFLDISKPKVNPFQFCKDDLDREIINYLIENKAGATSEIAEALGLESPKTVGRHTIGKRISRLKTVFERNNWPVLTFHPENKEGKFRAWWLAIEDIDVEGFKKEYNKLEPQPEQQPTQEG